jgi:serine/threonine protein kinase
MINQPGGTTDIELSWRKGEVLLSKYILEEQIGKGGFGTVFRSQQCFLDVPVREVAIKLSKKTGITMNIARDIFADAFLLAEVMDSMTDVQARSHLVHVYDMGIVPEKENRGLVVMEYVRGETLRCQFKRHMQVPENLMVKWAIQICLALQGLHTLAVPVLHRDLKPENILLGNDLRVRVIDFGLAAKMVQYGYVPGVVGTFAYMSCETMLGKSTPASDVYSLGVLLYEGLTGTHPFAHLIPPAGLPEALHKQWLCAQKEKIRPVPPSFHKRDLDNHLDEVVLRCLEFDPTKRYRDASELLKALNRDGDPPPPPPPDCLDEGRILRDVGDLDGARTTLEKCLRFSTISDEKRFALLCELGEVLTEMKMHCEAADRFIDAWQLNQTLIDEGTVAILRSRNDRAAVLERIVKALQDCGNPHLAGRYEKLL